MERVGVKDITFRENHLFLKIIIFIDEGRTVFIFEKGMKKNLINVGGKKSRSLLGTSYLLIHSL